MIERACLTCGEPERDDTPEHKIVQHRAGHTLPPTRCQRCGSSVVLPAEYYTVTMLEELDPAVWDRTTTRGRPPKWLVEQRARQKQESAI